MPLGISLWVILYTTVKGVSRFRTYSKVKYVHLAAGTRKSHSQFSHVAVASQDSLGGEGEAIPNCIEETFTSSMQI